MGTSIANWKNFRFFETLTSVIFDLIFAVKPPKFQKSQDFTKKMKPQMVSMKPIKWFQGFQQKDLFLKIY